ncbi:hypothetical protein, partial [Paraburkholderia xenovorans]|uniref:hypothetical protein n=1 Tax=Paraburkholderia xenovorans TaxID=36873 RepID=UPI001C1315FA
ISQRSTSKIPPRRSFGMRSSRINKSSCQNQPLRLIPIFAPEPKALCNEMRVLRSAGVRANGSLLDEIVQPLLFNTGRHKTGSDRLARLLYGQPDHTCVAGVAKPLSVSIQFPAARSARNRTGS